MATRSQVVKSVARRASLGEIPPTPTLTATAASSSTINVSVSPPASPRKYQRITNCTVEWSADGSTWNSTPLYSGALTTTVVTPHTGRTADTTYYYRARTTNGITNSAYATDDATTPPVLSTGTEWNPGHYMQLPRSSSVINPTNVTAGQNTRWSMYDAIASNTHIKGVCVPMCWAQLEGAFGNYSVGIAMVQAEINKLKSLSVPKRMWIRMMDQSYGSVNASWYPAYIQTPAYNNGYATNDNGGSLVQWWTAAVADRLIALFQAYGSVLNGEPYFEGLYMNRETATGGNPTGNFNSDNYMTQLRRGAAAMKAAFPNKLACIAANYTGWNGSQEKMDALLTYCFNLGVGWGTPDLVRYGQAGNPSPQGYSTYLGLTGGTDWRGQIPNCMSVEDSNLNGGVATNTIQELRSYANNTLQTSHIFWNRGTHWDSVVAPQTTSMLSYINTDPVLVTTPPTSLVT